MAVAIITDIKSNGGRFVEESGAASEFQRTIMVTGLTSTSGSALEGRIAEARTAVNAAGYAHGDAASFDSNLRVASQEYSTIENDNSKLMCTVTYKAVKDTIPPVGLWVPVLSGTLNQIQTAKDVSGFPITVSHTFPDDDPNWFGRTVTQGAKVNQFRPLVEITYRGLMEPASMFNAIIKYLGKTNSSTWLYGAPGRWLCTGFTAERHDSAANPDTWLCEVTFQADGYRWTQTAVFVDPATGKEPDGLVPGVGIKEIITQYAVDFNELIPSN